MSDPNPERPIEPTELAHTPPSAPATSAKLVAETFGTLLLVFGGVGTAVFASNHFVDTPAAVYTAVALAFGLTVVAGAYAFGPISGGHFNPAVTLGLAAAGRFPWREAGGYIIAQVIGGVIATTLLVLIGTFGPANWITTAQDAGFASNGWDNLSPAGFGMPAAMIAEVVLTGLFVLIILGVTHPTRGNPSLAGLAIGLSLALIHFISIPVDNTSVNPARSIASAIYGGGEALLQLWVFILFPIAGAMLAGVAYRSLLDTTRS
ncbi:aquaporin [Microbacterium sp.]|uniref:aquaporin n=1 Tax=Microbacterium sp. TaxID=51671 RepID=UPI00281196DE|nr:aquaporin [Microbacterium sp.]